MAEEPEFTLAQENLIPFYIIEDRIKENFSKIEKVLKRQAQTNQAIHQDIHKINDYNAKYKE